jgi:polyisoprenoid-binding protein YceI
MIQPNSMTRKRGSLAYFVIDVAKSLFTVQAFSAGLVADVAHSPTFAIRDFSGEMEFMPGNIEIAAARLRVNVASLEIMDEVSKWERAAIERVMFDEVLEKHLYPQIEYKSSWVRTIAASQNLYQVGGALNLHGVTRELTIDAQIFARDDTLRAMGSFFLKQSDYNLTIATVAGGTLKLKDELKFSYFLVARPAD